MVDSLLSMRRMTSVSSDIFLCVSVAMSVRICCFGSGFMIPRADSAVTCWRWAVVSFLDLLRNDLDCGTLYAVTIHTDFWLFPVRVIHEYLPMMSDPCAVIRAIDFPRVNIAVPPGRYWFLDGKLDEEVVT